MSKYFIAGCQTLVLPKEEKTSYEDPLEEEMTKKPPFTYTELIECALEEKGPLTVSEIYQWIS